MSLSDELLIPIPGSKPAGTDLRYDPLYNKIEEARREEPDLPQGDLKRERKLADWPLTIKLLTEALSKKTKDLQMAAWLTEALLRRHGISGLNDGLRLLYGLVEQFWDSVHPELEEDGPELRATPLNWVGGRLEHAVKSAPLTASSLSFYQYQESRTVGYDKDTVGNEERVAARLQAIAEHKVTAEAFDEAFAATPKTWYVQLLASCDSVVENIGALTALCDKQFGTVAPRFSKLQAPVEEFRRVCYILLEEKRKTEPDPIETPAPVPEPAVTGYPQSPDARATALPGRSPAGEPTNREDAVEWLVAASRYIRRQQPQSPAPYLMLRGFRWGELRSNSRSIDQTLLEPPPTEIRQQLKRLALQSKWNELLESAETAMGKAYGRGWLDIQRYVCRACGELGRAYTPISEAVKSELRTLLLDLPELPQMTLMDDTAAATGETLAWLEEIGALQAGTAPRGREPGTKSTIVAPPDPFELASQAVKDGQQQEGLEILSRELTRERSGRGRFQRRVQMAELCLSIGRHEIAFPLLSDVAAEIDARKLEEWEAPDTVAHPLSLLFRCLSKLEEGTDEKQEEKKRLYDRICRLDPAQAMACMVAVNQQ